MFSPFGVYLALAMTHAGTSGDTATEIGNVLGFRKDARRLPATLAPLLRGSAEENAGLSSVNRLWPQLGYPLRDEFLTELAEIFSAFVQPVDYGKADTARAQINEWVAQATAGNIKDFVASGQLHPETKLVLTNAISFKGAWALRFDPTRTVMKPFRLSNRQTVDVPMMTQTMQARYVDLGDVAILELAYIGSFSMMVALPTAVDGMRQCEREFMVDTMTGRSRTAPRRRVAVTMPKFRVQSKFSFRDILGKLGINDAFDSAKADFSRASAGKTPLVLSDVLQNAFVEVSEEGTEAGAASAAIIFARSAVPSVVDFVVDHPFLFWIVDQTTGILWFLGRFVTPEM